MDARGLPDLTSFAPIVETHLANTVLTNGARLYVDHAHPEYSSPECRTPLEATLYDVAGEEVMRRALLVANEMLEPHQAITLYKNNSDSKGNSYGTHENYLVSARGRVRPGRARDGAALRLASDHRGRRQGRGRDRSRDCESEPAFQLSSRAEFFEEVVGLETTLKRPIINTRDEPHSDAERFRRLHVIIGDANMSQVATFVKLGSTALLLAALEDCGLAAFPEHAALPGRGRARLRARSDVSSTPWCARTTARAQPGTSRMSCGPGQRLRGANTARAPSATPDEVAMILTQWRELLDGVRDDPQAVADRVDWVAKLRMVNGYQERHGLAHGDARLRAIDLQYHDLRAERSLAQRVGLRALHSEEDSS